MFIGLESIDFIHKLCWVSDSKQQHGIVHNSSDKLTKNQEVMEKLLLCSYLALFKIVLNLVPTGIMLMVFVPCMVKFHLRIKLWKQKVGKLLKKELLVSLHLAIGL